MPGTISESPAPISVLLAGERQDNILAALELFHDAGFAVDVISPLARLGLSRRIRRFTLARDAAHMVPLLRAALDGGYGDIVPCDDMLMAAVRDSGWSEAEKLRALPVSRPEDMAQLYSKIALSQRLEQAGISAPPYRAAHDAAGLRRAVGELGFPCFVKVDRSAGGVGTLLVESLADVNEVVARLRFPVVVQRRIEGRLVSGEVLYRGGGIAFFAWAEVAKAVDGPFGLTTLRRYRGRPEPGVVRELLALGQALGAEGFANIGLIETKGGERVYFEADLRPNAWVGMGRRMGEDHVARVRAAYLGPVADEGESGPPGPSEGVLMTHFGRAPISYLLLNRYRVWSLLPRGESPALLGLIVAGAVARRMSVGGAGLTKRLLGEHRHRALRRVYLMVCRALSRPLAFAVRRAG